MKRFFADQAAGSLGGYSEVTKAFQDVFVSVSTDTLQFHQDSEGEFQPKEGQAFIGRQNPASIQIPASEFNFDLLLSGMKESLVSKNALTARVKEAISNLAFLYRIDAVQMKNIVLSALTPDGDIDIEELRKAARDWYQFEHQDQLPQLMDRVQPAQFKTAPNAPKSEADELVLYFETASPRQLLIDISGGADPSKSEMQMIEDIMFKQKLMPGVVNVLVHYVMLRTDMKLTKSFIEKIASHWSRKKIKTVKEAMELAKKEHRQYLDWAEEKKSRPAQAKKQGRKEVLPDWFENKDSKGSKDAGAGEEDFDFEAEKRLLEEELKQFKDGR
jgi:replication initiation and membrane attachment protein